MINSIRLENFQAHKDTLLELHPGVNVIAGSSNSGKSSILRALNWLIYNRPSGEAFVSHWARDTKGNQKDNTTITVKMGELTVQRKKSKVTGNSYAIGEKVLEAVGLDVPEEVTKLLNLSEVNTQRQHDAPFLLSESSGEVARFFNKIVHFDAIDRYLSILESKKRKAKIDAEMGKENAERLGKSIAQYSWIETAEKVLEKINILEKERDVIDTESLEASTTQYRNRELILTNISTVLVDATKLSNRLDNRLPCISKVSDKLAQLLSEHYTYIQHKAIIEQGVDVEFAEKLIRKIDRERPLLLDMESQCNTLAQTLSQYLVATQESMSSNQTIEDLTASLPSTCPVCGKEL